MVNLGRMTVATASRGGQAMDVRKMHLHGKSEDFILQEMISRSYTKFTFKLEDVQVLLFERIWYIDQLFEFTSYIY